MSVTNGRSGIRMLGAITTIGALPALLFSTASATRERDRDVMMFFVAIAGAFVVAGIAAWRGNRFGAVVISVLSAFIALGLIFLMVRATGLRSGVIAANIGMAVLLLVPSIVTALEWRRRSRG